MANDDSSDQVRNLWQNQNLELFQMSPDEIRKRIQELDRRIRVKNVTGYVAGVLLIALFIFSLFVFRTLTERIGSLLTILGTGYIVYQIYLKQQHAKASSAGAKELGNAESTEFYRTELERQRNFHSGIWFWSRMVIFTPGPLIFIMGFAIAHPELAKFVRVDLIGILILALLAIPVNLRLARKYQRQIDKLDGLKEKTTDARS
jgi:hypothetical protein